LESVGWVQPTGRIAISDGGLTPTLRKTGGPYERRRETRAFFVACRFGRIGAIFAPACVNLKKRAKKHGENGQKSGGKWREMALFPKVRSAISTWLSRLRSIETCCSGRRYVCGVWLARTGAWARGRQCGAIFHTLGHDPTYLRHVRFDDCADFVARFGPPARPAHALIWRSARIER
jgi:hypothetical protein